MTVLSRVRKGRQQVPITACVFGVPGVGKTSFCAAAPSPLVWCIERGAEQLDVPKLDVPERRGSQTAWEVFLEDLRGIVAEPHEFKTLAIDTLDALEAIAISHVCEKGKKETLSDFDWGKGQVATADQWRLFLKVLEQLRAERHMNVLLVAHEHRKPFSDPAIGTFDCYRPKLTDRVWALTNEWCEAVLFADFETSLYERKGERSRGIVTGARVLRTERRTGFVAKNRYGLPPTIPLNWSAFATAIEEGAIPIDTRLRKRLEVLLDDLDDETVEGKAREYLVSHGDGIDALQAVINSVEEELNRAKGLYAWGEKK